MESQGRLLGKEKLNRKWNNFVPFFVAELLAKKQPLKTSEVYSDDEEEEEDDKSSEKTDR